MAIFVLTLLVISERYSILFETHLHVLQWGEIFFQMMINAISGAILDTQDKMLDYYVPERPICALAYQRTWMIVKWIESYQ